mgnify:CR=1 FL=1
MAEMLGLEMKLDKEYIEKSVHDIVKAAIAQALGDPTTILNAAIDSALTAYVDRDNGKLCEKGSWRSEPYLDYVAKQTIEETVREVMKEVIEENKEHFKAEIKKQLSERRFREKLTAQYLSSILNATEDTWKMPISVNFEKQKDEF